MKTAVPILMYHEVSDRAPAGLRKYALAPEVFRRQIRWLAIAGYQSITPQDLLDSRSGRKRLPRRPVILTFDDGYHDCVKNSFPVLEKHGFTAIFYIVAGLVGTSSRWLIQERGFELPLADWDWIRRLDSGGFHVGSHSMTHPHLTRLSSDACRRELSESRDRLEDRLGHEVTHLAYPFGSVDERVRSLVRESGYRTACSVRIGLSLPDDDEFALARVPINGDETMKDFVFRVRTARSAAGYVSDAICGIRRRLRRAAGAVP